MRVFLFKFIPTLLLVANMISCVGTIDSSALDTSITTKKESSSLVFNGVEELRSISHNKIEVYFYPAKGGSEKYSYKIYYGGNPLPQVTSSDVLNTDYRGMLRFTLNELDSAKNYIIRVDVEDQVTLEYTKTIQSLSVKTFSNKVVDFFGISNVSNVSGVDGIDSIKVRWTHAECVDALRCDQDLDPTSYEIILLDRTNKGLSPADFENRDLTQSDGRYVKVIQYSSSTNTNETVVRGLVGNTEYYVLVRAIHKGTIDDLSYPQLRSELNRNYLQIKTLNNDLANIDFETDALDLKNLEGEFSLTSVSAKWQEAVGVFDHYRLYYAPSTAGLNSGNLTSNCKQDLDVGDNQSTTILCKKVIYSESEAITTGLMRNQDYDFILVLCLDTACSGDKRIVSDSQTIKVAPEDPVFGGITSIEQASNINDFGTLKLNFEPVDTSVTYIDGYVVEYKENPAIEVDLLYEVLDVNDSSYVDGNISLLPYNPETANSLIVNGISYYESKDYCFKVYPFIFNEDGTRAVFENDNWKCINTPEYLVPSQLEFKGLRNVISQGTQVTLRWELPTNGVYEEFELYYVDYSSSSLVFATALQELDDWTNIGSSFGRITLAPGQTEITLSGFNNNSSFEFGILSNYNSTQGKLRSENNQNIVRCSFVEGQNIQCAGGY